MDLLDGYCLVSHGSTELSDKRTRTVYRAVCRPGFDAPGFALIDLGPDSSSLTLRSIMLSLKEQLSRLHLTADGLPIVTVWLGRFNQQITTKFHLDGGPDASLLMLGYEPTRVRSQVRLADYSRCAAHHNLTPRSFLDLHNPMFSTGEALLSQYVTDISHVNSSHFQILIVNNSCQTPANSAPGWQGVLHQAIILEPLPDEPRVVNSMLLTPGDVVAEALTESVRRDYLTTDQFNQRMS